MGGDGIAVIRIIGIRTILITLGVIVGVKGIKGGAKAPLFLF